MGPAHTLGTSLIFFRIKWVPFTCSNLTKNLGNLSNSTHLLWITLLFSGSSIVFEASDNFASIISNWPSVAYYSCLVRLFHYRQNWNGTVKINTILQYYFMSETLYLKWIWKRNLLAVKIHETYVFLIPVPNNVIILFIGYYSSCIKRCFLRFSSISVF